MNNKSLITKMLWSAIIFLFIGAIAFLFMENKQQAEKIASLIEDRNYFLLESASSTKAYKTEKELASSTIAELSERLALTSEELQDIESDLRRERNKNDDFEDQIKAISGTIGVLDKLSKTDKELLQKYSRTYFLNENFVPMKLSEIKTKYILPGKKDQYFHGDAIGFLTDMLDEAADDDIDLKVVSAYRSFDEQSDIKGQFTQVYGTGANTFSADQGYSEHQLGTTIDLSDQVTNGAYLSFGETEAFEWLEKNAYKYGFVLSYPEGNSFYIYEPWHWRFVGRDLANDLRRANATFYDWDQRKIDEYLVSIFD
jgi:LAS superfamily LD-carboxypeptidase LdcB